jgi:chemotaxis-related protein WspD
MNAPVQPADSAAQPGRCWRVIGVQGDHSCPELVQAIHCRNCPVFVSAALSMFDRPSTACDADQEADAPGRDDSPAVLRKADEERLFVFALGSTWCAVECGIVDEVAVDGPIRRLAHRCSGLLEGLVNVRGELLLSVAMDRLLGFNNAAPSPGLLRLGPGQCARRVIIGEAQERWSFRATRVLGIHYVARSALEAVPLALPSPLDRLLRGVLRMDDGAGTKSLVSVNVLAGKALVAALRQGI